MTTQTKYTQT